MSKSKLSADVQKADKLMSAGRFKNAEAALRQAMKRKSNDVVVQTRLIQLYNSKLKTPEKSAFLLPGLLKLVPKSPVVHQLAAETNYALKQLQRAKIHADILMEIGAAKPDVLHIAAAIYHDLGLYDQATACLDRSLHKHPDHLQSRLLQARVMRSAGDLAQAEAICRDIFVTHPNNMRNFSTWSTVCKQKPDDPMYLYLRDTVAPALHANTDKNLSIVLGLLGKAEDDLGNYDQAFDHFKQSKAISGRQHDRAVNKKFVTDVTISTSRADYFGWVGNPSQAPVLIVGMPRTGSTLLEQILSSHPAIGSIGESQLLQNIALKQRAGKRDGLSLSHAISSITSVRAAALADEYLSTASSANPGKSRIVDKKLHNFEHLGLFSKLFPKARIIHALRDPMDNCVSCYMQRLKEFHSYTNDLASLGQYYTEHRKLMDHWKNVLPNPILDVSYEDVVADTEGMARKIIDFLGLEWNSACLAFQDNTQRVETSSLWQVRQPIYRNSVKRWKRYEAHMAPLKAELQQLYPDGFDAE